MFFIFLTFFLFFKLLLANVFFFIVDLVLCQFLLYSKVTQSHIYKIYVHMCMYTHTHTHTHTQSIFYIVFHHCLSQEIGYISLYYSSTLLSIHSKCTSLHLSTSTPLSIPFPSPPSWQPQVCSPSP